MEAFAKSKQNHTTALKSEAKNLETLLQFTYLFSSGCINENGKHYLVQWSRKVPASLFQEEWKKSVWYPKVYQVTSSNGPHHGSGSLMPDAHHGGRGSISGQSTWNLWWIKCHWDRFFSKYFGLPPSVSFQQCFIFFHLSLILYNLCICGHQ
jgi:hypothetical protein